MFIESTYLPKLSCLCKRLNKEKKLVFFSNRCTKQSNAECGEKIAIYNSECGEKTAIYNTEFVDFEDLEIDHVESSSETKRWHHLQLKENSHSSQTRRTNETDYHHFHQKGKDWAERENKRS